MTAAVIELAGMNTVQRISINYLSCAYVAIYCGYARVGLYII